MWPFTRAKTVNAGRFLRENLDAHLSTDVLYQVLPPKFQDLPRVPNSQLDKELRYYALFVTLKYCLERLENSSRPPTPEAVGPYIALNTRVVFACAGTINNLDVNTMHKRIAFYMGAVFDHQGSSRDRAAEGFAYIVSDVCLADTGVTPTERQGQALHRLGLGAWDVVWDTHHKNYSELEFRL